jgi:hypothetical protein
LNRKGWNSPNSSGIHACIEIKDGTVITRIGRALPALITEQEVCEAEKSDRHIKALWFK